MMERPVHVLQFTDTNLGMFVCILYSVAFLISRGMVDWRNLCTPVVLWKDLYGDELFGITAMMSPNLDLRLEVTIRVFVFLLSSTKIHRLPYRL